MSIVTTQNIFVWIADQPDSFIDSLYDVTSTNISPDNSSIDTNSSVFACLAVFQSFSEICKIYVMRLIFLDIVNRNDMKLWTIQYADNDKIIQILIKFRIIIPISDNMFDEIEPDIFSINLHFRKNFLIGISNPVEPWSKISKSLNITVPQVSNDILESYSVEKWNNILRYLMNIKVEKPTDVPSNSIIEFLKRMVLVTENRQLTSRGYEFMLKDYRSQVRSILLTFYSYILFKPSL